LIRLILTISIVLATAVPSRGHAQVVTNSAKDVAARLRTQGDAGDAVSILTQQKGRVPRAALDAIADTLVAIATQVSDDSSGMRMRRQAALTLAHAGSAHAGGVPYAGAGERLLRIALSSGGSKGGAVSGLTRLADSAEALGLLRRIAIADDQIAYAAVNALANEMGPRGLEVARDLYAKSSVVREDARDILRHVARAHGWVK
jgi:hypothetical protein